MEQKDYLHRLQQGLSPDQRLNQISEHSMCIGCGLCASMIDAVSFGEQSNGYERPIAGESGLSHHAVDKIMQVCPGTRLTGLPSELTDANTKLDDVWGAWQEAYYSHSAEPAVRHLASTGGVLTGLALYLLESGSVDFVLHAKASTANPSFGEATVSTNRDDVIAAAGSRYGPTATLRNAIEILDRAEQQNQYFAFIGTPCDVSALRNLAKIDGRVSRYCKVMLTMVCGGFMAPMNMRRFIEEQGVAFSSVESIKYRGNGCPGPTTLTLRDGTELKYSYLDFWGDDEAAWGLPPRCKICPDGIGDAADIAAADTWPGGSPTVQGSKTDPGNNAVIVRTAIGKKIMDDACKGGYLARGAELTMADMSRFQPHQVKKKHAAWARLKGLEAGHHLRPEVDNLRLRKLSASNTTDRNTRELQGTKQRVAAGAFSEPSPKL